MKKYIIVSIIVAALFVGGSIGVAKALTTSSVVSPAKAPVTMSLDDFALNMAKGLNQMEFVKNIDEAKLADVIKLFAIDNQDIGSDIVYLSNCQGFNTTNGGWYMPIGGGGAGCLGNLMARKAIMGVAHNIH